jgi:hypothetical protein
MLTDFSLLMVYLNWNGQQAPVACRIAKWQRREASVFNKMAARLSAPRPCL